MKCWTLAVSAVVLGICQTGALAFCPSGHLNEILCDDFDTYCQGGGHPGETSCNPDVTQISKSDTLLRSVWRNTSTNEYNGNACGTEFSVEEIQNNLTSPPFGGRYPGQAAAVLGQQTSRDWVTGAWGLGRFIANTFGSPYSAVAGTDGAPLVMEFMVSSKATGAIFFSDGYMELAMGEARTNTDYINHPDCNTYCSPGISQGPFPIMCAQGNPISPLPAGCPSISTAAVRGTIAVGILAMLDPDPCHCGETAHGGQNYHLSYFDGKAWWTLKSGNPRPSSGTVTPKDDAPTEVPPEINAPGDFTLNGGVRGKAFNWVTLTVKTNTVKIELTTQEPSLTPIPGTDPVQYYEYYVTSVVDNLPRQYLGPFDRVRGGVGVGCPLDPAYDPQTQDPWETCVPNPIGRNRRCLDNNGSSAAYVDFDDFVLHSGAGYRLTGACCLPDASCTEVFAADCQTLGGLFKGPSSACDSVACCPKIYGDANHDGFVDMNDFAALQACITTGGGGISLACECLNSNGDAAIDGQDVQTFVQCTNGPGIPGNNSGPCSGVGW